jgi:hypothetical protein
MATDVRRTITVKNRIECKQDLIITRLQEFYTKPGHLEALVPIVQGTSSMSLRLVDYFVTNYAKKNNTSYLWGGRQFLVYYHYKRELNANSKRLFDPFCRRERILFEVRGEEPFVTTVGQLNFFSWAIERGILVYMEANRADIELDMNKTLKEHYSRENAGAATPTTSASTTLSHESVGERSSETSSRKRRSELTTSAMKKVNCHDCPTVVVFD